MTDRPFRVLIETLAGALAALAAGACDNPEKPDTLLDAAAIYAENAKLLDSIHRTYPGPYRDFSRLPPRDPADETSRGKEFIKALRREIPLDYIDFFPIEDTGGDEIDVVLRRYSTGNQWRTISLIYFSSALELADGNPNLRLFHKCDERALDWLAKDHLPGPYAAFCKINHRWYAYERVD